MVPVVVCTHYEGELEVTEKPVCVFISSEELQRDEMQYYKLINRQSLLKMGNLEKFSFGLFWSYFFFFIVLSIVHARFYSPYKKPWGHNSYKSYIIVI